MSVNINMNTENKWSQLSDDENKPGGNKRYDFMKGAGIGCITVPLLTFIGWLAIFSSVYDSEFSWIVVISIILGLVYLGFIIAFLYMGRWKFALGLISVLLIPFAIFGGCLLIFFK